MKDSALIPNFSGSHPNAVVQDSILAKLELKSALFQLNIADHPSPEKVEFSEDNRNRSLIYLHLTSTTELDAEYLVELQLRKD